MKTTPAQNLQHIGNRSDMNSMMGEGDNARVHSLTSRPVILSGRFDKGRMETKEATSRLPSFSFSLLRLM